MARAVHEQPCSENQGSNSKDNMDKSVNSDEESHEESNDTKGTEDIVDLGLLDNILDRKSVV